MHHGLGQGVHGPERLVEQEHAGGVHHGPGDFHAAAHTRGNLARVVVFDAHEAHLAEHLHGLSLRLLLTHDLLDDGPEGDVLKHGEPREQRAVLEDHDAVGAGLRLLVGGAEHFAVEEDFPAADAVEARDGVVLPHPEGPTTTQNSPGAMSMVQRSTARTLAPSGSYILLTLLIWMCPRMGVSLPLIVLPP